MTTHEIDPWSVLASLAITYLVHSTLLLGGVAACVILLRIRRHVLLERLWKLGAVVAVFTAPALCVVGNSLWPIEIVVGRDGGTRDLANLRHIMLHSASSPSRGNPQLHVMTSAAELRSPEERLGVAGNPNNLPLRIGRSYLASAIDLPSSAVPSHAASTDVPGATQANMAGFTTRRPLASAAEEMLTHAPARHALTASTTLLFRYLVPSVSGGFVVCGCVFVLIRAIRFHRRMSKATAIRHGVARSLLDGLITENEVRRPIHLLGGERYCEPGAFGIFRWTIIVPHDIEHGMQQDELRGLLAHELAHLVRGDVIWMWIGRVLCTCLAFQPLNFIARRRWQNAAEYLCDDWAMAHGVPRVSLARCLTQIAEWQLDRRLGVERLAVSGSPGTVSHRVTRLVNDDAGVYGSRDPGRGRNLRMTALAFSLAFCFVAPHVRVVAQADQPAKSATSSRDLQSQPPRIPDIVAAQEGSWPQVEHELELLENDMQRVRDVCEQVPLSPEIAEGLSQLRHRSLALQRQRATISQIMQRSENDETSVPSP